jgi:hypothetical protein
MSSSSWNSAPMRKPGISSPQVLGSGDHHAQMIELEEGLTRRARSGNPFTPSFSNRAKRRLAARPSPPLHELRGPGETVHPRPVSRARGIGRGTSPPRHQEQLRLRIPPAEFFVQQPNSRGCPWRRMRPSQTREPMLASMKMLRRRNGAGEWRAGTSAGLIRSSRTPAGQGRRLAQPRRWWGARLRARLLDHRGDVVGEVRRQPRRVVRRPAASNSCAPRAASQELSSARAKPALFRIDKAP